MIDKFRLYDKENKKMTYFTLYDLFKQSKNNIILMHSTGIKDKNGKLIFEGDIVKTNDGSIHKIIRHKYDREDCFEDNTQFELDDTCGFYAYELEVIGNIYENKETKK